MENTQATTTHPELAEAELEHATGGDGRPDNYKRDCIYATAVTLDCLGGSEANTSADWCVHYITHTFIAPDNLPQSVLHRCAKYCFNYRET